MADNRQLAEKILDAVGGRENIANAAHCMTRLRLNLKDTSVPSDEEIRKIPGVLGVNRNGDQYQVIIGPSVSKVYDEVCRIGNFAKEAPVEENLDGKKDKMTLAAAGKNILNYMTGCMTPMIPVLLAAGLCRAFNAILGPNILGLYGEESDIYVLFEMLYEAGLYFMPILIGFSGAKLLGANQMMGAFAGAILITPSFVNIVNAGETFTVFGIPCTLTSYGQTAIPAMLSVAAMSMIYRFFKKYVPDALTTIFTPFLTILVTAPIELCLLAPLGTIIGNGISTGLLAFSESTGFLGVAVIAALWEFLVMTGMHLALMMPMMASFFETGVMTGAATAGTYATWAVFGVALGAMIRLKGKHKKGESLGFFISGIVGGITEPTLYGICFNYKKCFLTMAAGAFIGGAYAGITNTYIYTMASANFLSLLGFTGASGMNVVNGVIACILSMAAAAVLTAVFGFSKSDRQEMESNQETA